MKILRVALVSCVLFAFSQSASAWSALGHAQIAEAAFSQLTEKEQQVLLPIFAAGPWMLSLGVSGQGAAVARAAIWPDRIRHLTVADLFKRYGSGRVPSSLQSYQDQDTRNWHFANAYVLNQNNKVVAAERSDCPPPSVSGQLFVIWEPLLRAFSSSTDLRDRAVILAFVTHLVADAYQPLHTLAKVDQACNDDHGGNLFCVVRSKGKSCKSNLHQLWDEGFGVFDNEWFVATHVDVDRHSLVSAGASWQGSALLIYPRAPEMVSSIEYTTGAHRLVRQQANLASAHLRLLLLKLGGV